MVTVLCDASPLIFLSKINRLDLIENVLGKKIKVLRCVAEEVLSEKAPPLEAQRLGVFFESAEVIDFVVTESKSTALSQSDQSTLQWAITNQPDWLLVDERLLRNIARAEGLQVMGVLGLLASAVKNGSLSKQDAIADIRSLVNEGGFRISLQLYQRVLEELEH